MSRVRIRTAAQIKPWIGLRPFLLVLLLAIPGGRRATAHENSTQQTQLPLLTEINQIRQLTLDEANRGYPVQVRAVVTYCDGNDLFIQDSSAGIWVNSRGAKLSLKTGDFVEVDGISAGPDFAPQINKPRVRVLGKAPLPAPRRVSFDRLASSAEDSQWVEVEGIIHAAAVYQGHLGLQVAVGKGRLIAMIADFGGADPAKLVDAKVRMFGACGAIFNQRNQLTVVRLNVPSLKYVEIVEATPSDPFSLPARAVESLMRFTPRGASGHRVKVRGVVTFQQLGRYLFILEKGQGLYVQSPQATVVEAGDVVEVVGFPALGGYTAFLQDSIFRRVGRIPAPVPSQATAQELLRGNHDSELVRIDARLLEAVHGGSRQRLALEASDVIFGAYISGDERAEALIPSIPAGSRVQVTGICTVQVDENRRPRSFKIWLRSERDLVVVERPSWWTLPHALTVVGLLALLLLVAIGWAATLGRQVHAQTGVILSRLQREVVLERRYRDLFENATDIIYTHDLAGNLTSLNRAGEQVTGYSRHEALGMNLAQIVTPEDRELAFQMFQRGSLERNANRYEIEVIAKDGHRVPLEVSTRVIQEEGTPVGVQGNARDITDRRRAEEEQQKFVSLIENSKDFIAMASIEGQILYVKEAGQQLVGVGSLEQARSMHLSDCYPEEAWIQIRETALPMVMETGHWVGETRFRRLKTAEAIDVQMNIFIVRQRGTDKPLCLATVTRDITERKRAEAELKKAKETAEAASRAKSEFLANVSHEIRTPMNGILGMTELVLDTPLSREQREYIEVVKSSADSLLTVINDILDFSKIEARKLDLELVEFDLRECISEVIKPLAFRAHQKGLELACHFKPDVPSILLGDPGRLKQVIVNLVGNAIKFTTEGVVLVRVELESQSRQGACMRVSVCDTGIGIPKEKQAIVFEAFRQADGSTTRKFGGTGLGLSISAQLVSMMGGQLQVKSEPGKGSSFHFTVHFGLPKGAPSEKLPALLETLRGVPVLVVDTARRTGRSWKRSWPNGA